MRRLLLIVSLSLVVCALTAAEASACFVRWSGFWCGPRWGFSWYSWGWGCPSWYYCGPGWTCPTWWYTPIYCPVTYPVYYTYPIYYSAAGYPVPVAQTVVVSAAPRSRPEELGGVSGLPREQALTSALRRERTSVPVTRVSQTRPTDKPMPAARGSIPADRAKVVVELPADARLFVENRQLQTTAGRRQFLTPPLEPGATYRYTFRAEVERGGKKLTEVREAHVRAGQETVVRFDLPPVAVAAAGP